LNIVFVGEKDNLLFCKLYNIRQKFRFEFLYDIAHTTLIFFFAKKRKKNPLEFVISHGKASGRNRNGWKMPISQKIKTS
jgi:hypothetical protein